MKKRLFDLAVVLLAAIVWVPVLCLCALSILLLDGRPLLYFSTRRVFRSKSMRVPKLRVMRREADRIANRQTLPFEAGVRFLNLPIDSPLYTPVGRVLERCCFTELPQLFHVITGQMSLVGNRPLPEDVICALREAHPSVEDRFLSRAGLTGPVQLVGRARLSDHDRLRLEIAYCRLCETSYSARVDFLILLYTVLIAMRILRAFSVPAVEALLTPGMAPGVVEGLAGRSSADVGGGAV